MLSQGNKRSTKDHARSSRLRPLRLICAAFLSVLAQRAMGQEALVCGEPFQRSLEPDAVATYTVKYRDPEFPDRALVDAVDTSGNIGLLKLERRDDPVSATCGGVLDLEEEAGEVEVSDCLPNTAAGVGEYTIVLSVVSDSAGNCGVPLPCGVAVPGTLGVPGQVNSYTFPVNGEGEVVTVILDTADAESGAYHLRIFDPEGDAVEEGDSCDGTVSFEGDESGLYTVLVDACGSPRTGSYTITWRPPACPATIAVGSASGQPGQQVSAAVTLHTTGQRVTDVLVDLEFDTSTPIAWRADNSPDCAVNPDIQEDAAPFLFQPDGCVPGVDCTDLHAIVSASGGAVSIPDGSELFTCNIRIQSDAAAGSHSLTCADAVAIDSRGEPIFTTWNNGTIMVSCTGDCNDDGQVTIDELIRGVNIALGGLPVSACPAFNAHPDDMVTIDELLAAVTYALGGCGDGIANPYDAHAAGRLARD